MSSPPPPTFFLFQIEPEESGLSAKAAFRFTTLLHQPQVYKNDLSFLNISIQLHPQALMDIFFFLV